MTWIFVAVVVFAVGAWVLLGAIEKSAERGIAGVLGMAGVGESRAKWARGVVAVLIVGGAAVWWYSGKGDSGTENDAGKVQPAAMVVSGPAVAEKPAPVDCSCASGATCTGPRGGQYCLTGDGNKRYK